METYHNVKVKLSDFQLNKPKFAAKNATGVTFRLSSGIIGTDFLILN